MAKPDVILDPDGDLLVILRNASSLFNSYEEPELREPAGDSEDGILTVSNSDENSELSDMSNDRVYKCSLKLLSFCCPRAKRMMDGPWREARKIHKDGLCHWVVEGFDVNALTIVLSLVHHEYSEVPKEVELDLLVGLARIVDYIGCSKVIKCHASNHWIPALKASIPKSYGAELMLWICISGVFCEEQIFRDCTRVAILESHSGIPTFGLPILPQIAGEIDRRKEQLLDQIFEDVRSLKRQLKTRIVCTFKCDGPRLFMLLKHAHASSLSPWPRKPYTKLSVRWAIRALHCLPDSSILDEDDAYVSWVRACTEFTRKYPLQGGYSSVGEDMDEIEIRRRLEFHPLHCGYHHLIATVDSLESDLEGLDIKKLKKT